MESTLPLPSSHRHPLSGDLLHTLSRAAFGQILRILGGGVWRARTEPFELVDWAWGTTTAGDEPSGLPFPEAEDGLAPAWENLIYPPDLPIFRRALEDFIGGAKADGAVDYRIIVGEGELLWLRQWFLDRDDSDETGRALVTGLVREVSEEKRLQWEVMRTSESERGRIGQEIHDDVCQVLAGINCLTHLLHQRLAATHPEAAAELERINVEIQGGLERTRALAHGLLPAKSDFNTLQQAFRDLSRQVATRFNLQLSFELEVAEPQYSRERLLHLYRIVQEASSNAFKHGRATRVDVTFNRRDGWDVLSIRDNGKGLPAEATPSHGVGLNVMRNRAEVLGGRLEIGHAPEGGAVVKVFLPAMLRPVSPSTEALPR